MTAPIGSLEQVNATEDRLVFAYLTPRRPLRGILDLLMGLVAFGFAVFIGARLKSGYGWLIAIFPIIAAAVLVAGGLRRLIPKALFELELDRRARTIAVSMRTEAGSALRKLGFDEVAAVDVVRGAEGWRVRLDLKEGRRIGLGCLPDGREADALAARFSELVGVPVRPTSEGT